MFSRRARFAVRWRRAGWGLRLTVFAACLAMFIALVFLQHGQNEIGDSGGSFLIYSLVNLNFILLLVFGFLIGRNIVKLVFDRKRKLFGAKLRSRLVGAFVTLVLIPSLFIFLFASGLITKVMEGWFSEPIEVAISGAVDIAKTHFQVSKKYLQAVADDVAHDVRPRIKIYLSDTAGKDIKDKFLTELDQIRKNWGLFSLRVVRSDGQIIAEVFNPTSTIENFAEPAISLETIAELDSSRDSGTEPVAFVQLEEKESRQFLRGYRFLDGSKDREGSKDKLMLILSLRIAPEMTQTMESVNSSFRRYEELKFYKGPLKSSNILTLALFTMLLLFSAIWLAFYLARDLTGPMLRLAEATKYVAEGRYDFRLKESGDDELGLLVQSFNQMTDKLRVLQDQSEARRAYLETVLGSLAVSVLSLDAESRIIALNKPASKLLEIGEPQSAVGKLLWEVVPLKLADEIRILFEHKNKSDNGETVGYALEKHLYFDSKGQRLELLATLARILDKKNNLDGYVLVIDDLTDLARAQQSAAWMEVAQRVAHEIKNPLTPIQISAQRLIRLAETLDQDSQHRAKIEECCGAVLENVDSIKRLADEFRRYARMPTPEFGKVNLNQLLAETVQTYANGHPDITFEFNPGVAVPEVTIDAEQIRRCLINLVDNALQIFRRHSETINPSIIISSGVDWNRNRVFFEVTDNGPGVPSAEKKRIFEPHVSSKPEGGGLGLAIVSSILREHEGSIRVLDNLPSGAKFLIELPVQQSPKTIRKFATA